jgi:hypothetical protein
MNQFEAQAVNFVAGLIENHKAEAEAALGHLNTVVVEDGTKLVEEADAHFGPAAAVINAALAEYGPKAEAALASFEGTAIDKLVAYLRALAAPPSAPAAEPAA